MKPHVSDRTAQIPVFVRLACAVHVKE